MRLKLPKLPSLTSQEAESMLLKTGYEYNRSKGSHRIYIKGTKRVVLPFHSGKILHPKIIKQVLKAVETAEQNN